MAASGGRLEQDSGYGGLYPLKSNEATVHVRVADRAPAVLWTGGGADANWSTAANSTTGHRALVVRFQTALPQIPSTAAL